MGLRERNAARTREQILQAALELFVEHGYDATTMEEVARRADVSPSTLYRYFPAKEQLVSEPLALRGQMAAELASRPDHEPLDVALGHALTALVATPRLDTDRMRQLLGVLDAAPGPQARVREDFMRERVLLQQAIARRSGRSEDDACCQITARLTTSLLEMVGERDPAGQPSDNQEAVREALDFLSDLLEQLRRDPPVLPVLAPPRGR